MSNSHPHIDREIEWALKALALNRNNLSFSDVEEIRRIDESLESSASLPGISLTDLSPKVFGSSQVLRIRIRRPADVTKPLPWIYWIHGGGLMFGSSRIPDPRLDQWCSRLMCVCASVEYRLAPEAPYPAPMQDCYAGLLWVQNHADELGIDGSSVVVGGSSAGGGLAAGLSMMSRDRQDTAVASQLLLYPMLDDRCITKSIHWPSNVWPLTANRLAWSAYLGDSAGKDDVDPYAAPARATDLTGLPSCFLTTGGADCFFDEIVDYASRLTHSGVPTEFHVYPRAPHGFDSLAPNTVIGRQSRRDAEAWLRKQLHPFET